MAGSSHTSAESFNFVQNHRNVLPELQLKLGAAPRQTRYRTRQASLHAYRVCVRQSSQSTTFLAGSCVTKANSLPMYASDDTGRSRHGLLTQAAVRFGETPSFWQ